ncbi:hypothetical protein J4450_05040 [Candidatus Micrarchaeota archaeon]|nr:hypothetical protein [Candidatus Micrarchaeota archaeon]
MENVDLICDTSSLVSLTDSCLDNILYFLHDRFNFRFLIPPSVESEAITRPLSGGLRQYAFSALKLTHAMNRKTIIRVDADTKDEANKVLYLTNNLFFIKGKPLRLVHLGEAEMIGLARTLNLNTLLIDERTTRMLIEAPFKIKEHLEIEFGVNIMINKENLMQFSEFTKGMEIIRSSELLILAYENGYLDNFDKIKTSVLEAALNKVKFSGCAIRFDEIQEFIKQIK